MMMSWQSVLLNDPTGSSRNKAWAICSRVAESYLPDLRPRGCAAAGVRSGAGVGVGATGFARAVDGRAGALAGALVGEVLAGALAVDGLGAARLRVSGKWTTWMWSFGK